jgi:carboxyl-terminal processing protease
MLVGTFSVYHPLPIQITEQTSQEVVDLFIDEIGEHGIYLTEPHVKAIEKNKRDLFKQINDGNDAFVTNALETYKRALASNDSLLTVISGKTLNYSENDTITFLPYGQVVYSPGLKSHGKRLERFIKGRAYDRVLNTDDYEKLTEAEFNKKANEFSKTIITSLKKNIADAQTQADIYIPSNLLNAIALRHDPHSNFFTEEQHREFNKALSAQVESFGLYFGENDEGEIFVADIEPGGSAWLSNEINQGDIFISYRMGNELVNNENITAGDLQTKIDNSPEKKMSLTLKKKNGLTKTIALVKQKIASAENTVKGYVLMHEGTNFGYISLPSFYTDMDEHNKPGCANDVAKEILKLENDTIQGLILDLRNNGGGSMQEAMDLAGIFIDEGPLFIYKETGRKPSLIKDVNRGSIFKKPLIVMINEFSASASELFSNVVKDYNVGVVIGQTSYGKGSAQSVLPLDTNILRYKSMAGSNKDFIKMTNGRFYRLNCSTHQGVGVVPDVILPASIASMLYKESKESFYLKPDSVVKKVMFSPNPPLPISQLQTRSQQRVSSSKSFSRYALTRDSVDKLLTTKYKVPLKFKEFKKNKEETDKLYTSLENALNLQHKTISCRNNTFDKKLNEVNETTKEFNQKIIESIQNDIYIDEAYYILKDLRELKK